MSLSHDFFMRQALQEAQLAAGADEIPVGAVMVLGNRIIARAHNQVERLNDATAHAEILAITSASAGLQSKYLQECTLFVTLEPCVMCAGAIHWAQIGQLVFGAFDPKKGFSLWQKSMLSKNTRVKGGVLAHESSELLKGFFTRKRKQAE